MVKESSGYKLADEEAKVLVNLKNSKFADLLEGAFSFNAKVKSANIRNELEDKNGDDKSGVSLSESKDKLPEEAKVAEEAEVPEEAEEVHDDENQSVAVPLTLLAPLTYEDMNILSIKYLFEQSEESKYGRWIENKLAEVFREDYQPQQSLEELKDERWQKISREFIAKKSSDIKTASFSLNADVLNEAMEDMLKLAGLEIDIAKTPRTEFMKMIKHRFSQVPEMRETIEVFDTSLGIFNFIASNAQIVPSRIELENKVQKLEDYYSNGSINKSQMALGYHNLAILTERLSKSLGVAKQAENYEYMRKALSLTNDPTLIKTCFEYLPNNINNKMVLVQEACDRAFMRKDIDDLQLYKLHMIYAKSLVSKEGGYRRNFEKDVYREILYHYRQALKIAKTDDSKAKTLRNIIKLQKGLDSAGYFKSRVNLVEHYLSGKTKVRELIVMANEITRPDVKKVLLESAANELIDTASLSKEERSLLLKNVFGQLKPLYEKDNEEEKIKIVGEIEEQYCLNQKPQDEYISRISSKGRDYFDRSDR